MNGHKGWIESWWVFYFNVSDQHNSWEHDEVNSFKMGADAGREYIDKIDWDLELYDNRNRNPSFSEYAVEVHTPLHPKLP